MLRQAHADGEDPRKKHKKIKTHSPEILLRYRGAFKLRCEGRSSGVGAHIPTILKNTPWDKEYPTFEKEGAFDPRERNEHKDEEVEDSRRHGRRAGEAALRGFNS